MKWAPHAAALTSQTGALPSCRMIFIFRRYMCRINMHRCKHTLITANKHRKLQAVASWDVEPPPFSSSWFYLHLNIFFFFFYLLGGERLRPVVQNEPVFIEGFGLCRRFFALLPVCDFAVFIHGWDGPPATVGRGNMVGRRHDRAFCACGGEERGGKGWREREEGEERESERERDQRLERSSITGSRGGGGGIHQFGTAPRLPMKREKTDAHPNPYANTHLLERAAALTVKSMGNRVTSHDALRTNMRRGNPRRERFSGRSSGFCKDNGGCWLQGAHKRATHKMITR